MCSPVFKLYGSLIRLLCTQSIYIWGSRQGHTVSWRAHYTTKICGQENRFIWRLGTTTGTTAGTTTGASFLQIVSGCKSLLLQWLWPNWVMLHLKHTFLCCAVWFSRQLRLKSVCLVCKWRKAVNHGRWAFLSHSSILTHNQSPCW